MVSRRFRAQFLWLFGPAMGLDARQLVLLVNSPGKLTPLHVSVRLRRDGWCRTAQPGISSPAAAGSAWSVPLFVFNTGMALAMSALALLALDPSPMNADWPPPARPSCNPAQQRLVAGLVVPCSGAARRHWRWRWAGFSLLSAGAAALPSGHLLAILAGETG